MPTPLHAGAPGQRQFVSLFGRVRGVVRLNMSCPVQSRYNRNGAKEMFLVPAKQWDIGLLGVFLFVLFHSRVTRYLGRLGKRGSFGSSVLSSPNRPPRSIGVSHGPLHPSVFFPGLLDAVMCCRVFLEKCAVRIECCPSRNRLARQYVPWGVLFFSLFPCPLVRSG